MGTRTGFADLPLHHGRVPPWLAHRMASLGRVIVESLVVHYGRDAVLERLAHPFWFQSLGCVMSRGSQEPFGTGICRCDTSLTARQRRGSQI